MVKKRMPNEAEILLGKNIEALRVKRGLTRLELGRKIKNLEQQIAKYENGEFVPLPVLEAITSALGLPIEKKLVRKISRLRKDELDTHIEQKELLELYNEAFLEDDG